MEKGIIIAKTSRIELTNEGWKVPSQSGRGHYTVQTDGSGGFCDCPDYELHKNKCKHVFAAELVSTGAIKSIGDLTDTKSKRKTYPQVWKAYNRAQQNEKLLLMMLLGDLTNRVRQPNYNFGRPSLPLSDMVYSMVFKVYSTFSGRRFTSDMQIALEQGYVSQKPHFNSIFNYFRKEELTPLLADLVTLTSLPLKDVESYFSIDATGFGTSTYQRWHSFKYGRDISSRKWIKCHFMTGAQTNIITSVKITSAFDHDSPQLEELVNKTAENFDMDAVCGDMAYSSRANVDIINSHGATPYIPFRSNATGTTKGSRTWRDMYHRFQLKRDEFMPHYHTRSNVESTVQMIKSKFGSRVRSKTWTAQVNEVLCKIICHNICVNIQEMYELGIEPDFNTIRSLKN